jgi:DNA-binding NarL/FixJ family response regulator
MSGTVLVVVSDLMFQARIVDALRELGADARVIGGEDPLEAAITDGVATAVIDLHERSVDGLTAVRAAQAAGVRVLAFGRHTEPGLLRAARDAGAASVVPRSQLVEELPELLRSVLDAAADQRG